MSSILGGFAKGSSFFNPGGKNKNDLEGITNVGNTVASAVISSAIGKENFYDQSEGALAGNQYSQLGSEVGGLFYSDVIAPIEAFYDDDFKPLAEDVGNFLEDWYEKIKGWIEDLGLFFIIYALLAFLAFGIAFIAINKLLDKVL